MDGLSTTVLIGGTVLAGAVLAPRLRMAPPLLLLVLGLALGFLPALRHIELPPETVLLLFLPVMLFWESMTTSLRSIRRDLRGIVILSTLLVVATAFGVAATARAAGMPWGAALVLGAAVAPPDATAAAALGRSLPHRNFTLLKAESLTNDGTALVLYAIAVGAAVGGHYTPWDITRMVAVSYLGGIAIGAGAAAAAYVIMRHLRQAITINVALLLVPFTAYLMAELLHASGVLAVVVAGLVIAYASADISTAESRRQTESAWPLGAYLLNGALFVLMGFQVQAVVHDIEADEVPRLALTIVVVWVALMVIRFLFQTLAISAIRLLDRRPQQRARRMSHRARIVSSVAGFRGAISLAIALSVPATLSNGAPFAARQDIVVVTAGVIVLTLLVQGPLLPVVVRWANLPLDRSTEAETRLAQRAIRSAALQALPRLAQEHHVSAQVHARVARDYEPNLEHLEDRQHLPSLPRRRGDEQPAPPAALINLPGAVPPDSVGERNGSGHLTTLHEQAAASADDIPLRLALLDRKREVLTALRREGTIDDSVALRIQTQLDVEELRLGGITDPFE